MNWIEKMIAEQCPNGVKKVKFQDFATYTRGVTYNKSQESFSEDDSYKILRANNITLERNAINFDDIKFVNKSVKIKEQQWLKQNDILICAGSGSKEHVGKVAFIDQNINYSFGGFMAVIRAFDGVNSRYLFHNLTSISFHDYLTSALNSTTINNLNIQVMSGFEIPLPPISIQEEIVSVLDKFTELIENTDKEIELRQKQYEYYREKLLTFEEGEAQALKDIINHSCSGSTPTKSVSAYYQGGTIPWLRTQDVKFNEIYEIDSYITEYAVEKTAVKWIPENCVIVAISGATAGRCAINKIKTTTNQHCLNLEIDNKKADYKYVFYCVMNQYDDLIAMKQGARGDLNSSSILKLKIPVPSLARQQKIVATLDKFEAMISKLKEERELRQKQYEYYREKLLTF